MTYGILCLLFFTRPLFASAQTVAPKRVFLIGLDGLSWTMLDPLFSEGSAPNLRRCAERGTRGAIQSITGYLSPALWTTVATSKLPKEHGVAVLMTKKGSAGDSLYSSDDRKSAALWNILSGARKSVLIVGYLATYPAEPVNGIMLSDRFNERLPGAVYPAGVLGQLDRAGLLAVNGGASIRFLGPDPEYSAGSLENALIDRLAGRVAMFYIGDEQKARAAELLLAKRPYDFFAIHVWGTDSVAHEFARFSRFDARSASPAARRRLGPVIGRYYAYADEIVGRILKYADDQTVVVIMSDHGEEPDLLDDEQSPIAGTLAGKQYWSHNGVDGVLIACGPGIRKGASQRGASLYDIAPTILYLEGVPPAEDMRGNVLTDILEPALLKSEPVRRVKTYARETPLSPLPEKDDSKLKESLKAMGYLH